MENKDDIELEMQEIIEEEPATQEKVESCRENLRRENRWRIKTT